MAFPEDILFDDEDVIIHVRPHWLRLVPPVLALVVILLVWMVGAVAAWALGARANPDYVWEVRLGTWLCVVLGSALFAVAAWRRILYWLYTRYVVTSRRLIIRTGVLHRYNRDVPLFKIQDVHLDQGIIARMARAGNMLIEAAGAAGALHLPWAPEAQRTRRLVHQLAEDARRREREDSL